MEGHSASLSKFTNIGTSQSMFLDHNVIKLEINVKKIWEIQIYEQEIIAS
jgi:hypothetical protein